MEISFRGWVAGLSKVAGILSLGVSASALGAPSIHHELLVTLDPAGHRLVVNDRVTLAPGVTPRFVLHDGLAPAVRSAEYRLVEESRTGTGSTPVLVTYRVEPATGAAAREDEARVLELSYQGEIYHPLEGPGPEYGRNFDSTPGIISEEGVYLAASSAWYPKFVGSGELLLTFDLKVSLPGGWDAVSQGGRVEHRRTPALTFTRWSSPEPQDDIYLIGAQFIEYGLSSPGLEAMAFLRTPDPETAQRYLDVTERYIRMYDRLIGPYPYTKFALVENFWETGYGMPSFTLLGPKIIRFPFILESSYPHEILHNWWGNSVFVDYATGNWCEGLTAYLADHLMKEQTNGGPDYRRTTLQKYTDFVSESNDFPLSEFHERHSGATEAVGYGKALMLYHMLRQTLGDEQFAQVLQRFYRDQRFTKASFDDIRRAAEAVSHRDFSGFFEQWVRQAGAPELKVSGARATRTGEGRYELTAQLEQIQPGRAYALEVPFAVSVEGRADTVEGKVQMDGKRATLAVSLPGRPYLLDVDPQFDVFRRLNRNEIPPALSQGFGAKKLLFVLPAGAPEGLRQAYTAMIANWGETSHIETKLDSEITALPADRAVFVLGWENRFIPRVQEALSDYDFTIGAGSVRTGGKTYGREQHGAVVALRNPANPDQALVWVAGGPEASFPGIARKLPHYGKYGSLVFEGVEPKAVAQGIWPAVRSPMSVKVAGEDGSVLELPRAKLSRRAPLATVPSTFSAERMKSTIDWLASPTFKGRELGSPELDQLAEGIAQSFQAAGLSPLGSYFQTWEQDVPGKGRLTLRNVVGMIPGRNPSLQAQSVVLGAHYDHLGMGWPDAHAGNVGKVHPGADDNASGVAVLLELARYYGQQAQRGVLPERTLLFVAFTGEEAGLLGSKHFVGSLGNTGPIGGPGGGPILPPIHSMINFDTVGRLYQNKLTIFGTGSAKEWSQILMGVGYVTGVPLQQVAADIGASDQKSFIEKGIPAIQLFSGAHGDYHRPGDTPEKIDAAGLVKIAGVGKELTDYLGARKEPLTAPGSPGTDPQNPPGERKVYLGTVPDFAFAGPGVRLGGVAEGSPAQKAGLLAGDVIVRMNDSQITDLRAYSGFLKTLRAGDRVTVRYLREGRSRETSIIAIER